MLAMLVKTQNHNKTYCGLLLKRNAEKKIINHNKKIILSTNSSFKFQPEVQLKERKHFREDPRHF